MSVEWEYIIEPIAKDGAPPALRRIVVPGGWLYQVESHEVLAGTRVVARMWQPPTFVADKEQP